MCTIHCDTYGYGLLPGGILQDMTERHEPQAAPADPPPLKTASQIGNHLHLSAIAVRRMAKDGRLPCRRIGRLVRFRLADVEAALAAKE
jgi:excisionase family DNA binding protein